MPCYGYRCACGAYDELVASIKDHPKQLACQCGRMMEREIDSGDGYSVEDIKPYRSTLTGEMVTSRARHRQLLREHKCVEVGNEWNGDKLPGPPPRAAPGGLAGDLKRAYSEYRSKYGRA